MHIPDEYKDSAYHYAWITDRNDLVFRAKRAGFEHVPAKDMPQLSVDVEASTDGTSNVTMNVGGGDSAYLMKQPIEFYEEDKAEMRKLNDDRIADIKRDLNSGKEGTYGEVDIS